MMITYTQEELSSIVHAFAFPGTITDWTPHGNGHINERFWCAPPKTASSANRFCSA